MKSVPVATVAVTAELCDGVNSNRNKTLQSRLANLNGLS